MFTRLYYFNVAGIRPNEFEYLLALLPSEQQKDILRFKYSKERCLKLFAKLMLKNYLETAFGFSWSELHYTIAGKPYCNEKCNFNISHSGDFVLAAFSKSKIGIDIEQIKKIDFNDIIPYLHPFEINVLAKMDDNFDLFYSIWTRKEAFLKATGDGIVLGLNKYNCLQDEINAEEKWYLKSLDILKEYKVAICQNVPNEDVLTEELFLSDFMKIQSSKH